MAAFQYCQVCGASIGEGARFCQICGAAINPSIGAPSSARVTPAPDPGEPAREDRRRLWVLIAIGTVLIGAFGLGAIVYGPSILNPAPPEDIMLAHAQESVVTVNVIGDHVKVSGSGFFIDDSDHILTNYHVIKGAWKVTVTTRGGGTIVARLVSFDILNDVAELLVPANGPRLSFRQDSPAVGETIYVLGNPGGDSPNSSSKGTVTQTHVTQIVEGTTYSNLGTTDALVRPGNSGGPVVDRYGRVLGMVSVGSSITGEGGFIPNSTFNSELRTWSQFGTAADFSAPPPQIFVTVANFDGLCNPGCPMHATVTNQGGPGVATVTFTVWASNNKTVLGKCAKGVTLNKGDTITIRCVVSSASLANYFYGYYRRVWGDASVTAQSAVPI